VRDVYSFLDYMGTQDNGVLPFQEFIKRVKMPAGGAMGDAKPSDEEVTDERPAVSPRDTPSALDQRDAPSGR
jgi:hypothetical protein